MAMLPVLYHNPRCSKSRAALKLLQEQGAEFEVVRYLESPPDEQGLRGLLSKLGMKPLQLMRRSETLFRDLKLGDAQVSDDERILAMVANPILIERPILVSGDRACVGRPPERVLEVLPGRI